MTPRFNLPVRGFARRYFRHFDLEDASVAKLRGLEEQGAVVYVMRYASRLDYFLFNTLFAREGLRLSAFANGISFYYYRPVLEALKGFFRRRSKLGRARRLEDRRHARAKAREVVSAGQSMFLFLRTTRLRNILGGHKTAVRQGQRELDLLREVVRTLEDEGRPVHLVPLALFWRKGPRTGRRFLNLAYGSATWPSDLAKVSSFLVTYRDLSIKVGEPIDLAAFAARRREEDERAIARKVRRAILLFLYREERAVEGPTLRSRWRVQESVLESRGVLRAVGELAKRRKSSPEAARAQAEKIFREIAANMNSTFLAALNFLVSWLFRKLFVSIETQGLEKVAAYARRQPVVLVPSHRSYFDFLILSVLFYNNYLVPPHIAARDNMAFGPFGFLFRRAGAFFMRRSFDDKLYKAVFSSYVQYLVREGFTQEFFIEGARSRTGKSLAPRMGMLSWNVQGFIESGRRDLYFVPVGITYERLVEEGSMLEELGGAEKKSESMLGLVRARKLLSRKFGSVFVNFGEPISLARALDGRRELFLGDENPERLAGKRAFTEALGNEIVERINWAMVANSTSVAACALLGEARRGMFRDELTERMREVVAVLRLQDVRLTPALAADEGEFQEAIAFLLRAGLIKSQEDPRGEILYYEEAAGRALDVYRNVLFHFMVAPSLMARRILEGGNIAALREDVTFWLDLLYQECFVPRTLVCATHLEAFIDYFERMGALESCEGDLRATEKGRGYLLFLAEQTRGLLEAYYAAFSSFLTLEGPRTQKALEKQVQEQFQRAYLLGEIQRLESWNAVTFRNALALMTRRGILERSTGEKEGLYGPGPAFDELAGLRERLAAAVGAR